MKIKSFRKRARVLAALCLVCAVVFSAAETSHAVQSYGKSKSKSGNYGGNELGRFEFEFNPVGFFQFGPMVDLGVRVGPVTYIDAHFRYPYLGVVYQVIETNVFKDTPLLNCGAVGVRINNVIRLRGSLNAWYFGAVGEYNWGGTEVSKSGTSWLLPVGNITYTRKWQGFVIALRAGFRWRWASGFYMNLGLIAGIFDQYRASYNIPALGYPLRPDPKGVIGIGMIEFSLGAEF
jgi:hypothetical protein